MTDFTAQSVIAEMTKDEYFAMLLDKEGRIIRNTSAIEDPMQQREAQMAAKLFVTGMAKGPNDRTPLTLAGFAQALEEQGDLNTGQVTWLMAQGVPAIKEALRKHLTEATYQIPAAEIEGASGVCRKTANNVDYSNGGNTDRGRVKALFTFTAEDGEAVRWNVGDYMIVKSNDFGHGSVFLRDLLSLESKLTVVKGEYVDSRSGKTYEKDAQHIYRVPGSGQSKGFEVTVTFGYPNYKELAVVITG